MSLTSQVEKWVDEVAALTGPAKIAWADGSKAEYDRLVDAVHMQASGAVLHDTGCRACDGDLRARDLGRNAALCRVVNRLVGIPHGCLKTGTSAAP